MIRFATIGTSWITSEFADAVSRVPGVEVTTVYSRDPARAQAYAAELGAPGWSADLDGLLASDAIDAVYVASPNAVHAGQALAAVRAGKHVLVEKPATTTAAEFVGLVEAAGEAGVVLLEAMRTAYDPGTVRVRELLPALGTLRLASLRYCQRSSRYDKVLAGEQVNVFDPGLGGGALNDIGVYVVSALVDLFGEPEEVLARNITIPGGADGAGAALARYPGLVVELAWSKVTGSDAPSEVQGERGTLVIDHLPAPRDLAVRAVDGTLARFTIDAPVFDLAPEVRRFAELVGGRDPGPDHARTLATLRTMEAIRAVG